MYQDNEERDSAQNRQGRTPPDSKIIGNQNENSTQMQSVSFIDYDSYKKKFLSEDEPETKINTGSINSDNTDLSHQKLSESVHSISNHQTPFGNQNVPQVPPDHISQNISQNQYQYGNQYSPQVPPGYVPQNNPQNQYQYGNQYSPQVPPGYVSQNNPQNNPHYINTNVPPLQPGFGYHHFPPSQPTYYYPNMPQGQFYPGNPYLPHFRQMPRDLYTLNEIRKSYNRTGLTLLIHSFGIIIIQFILIFVFTVSAITGGTGIYELFTSPGIEAPYAFIAIFSISLTNISCAFIGLAFTRRVSEFPRIFKMPQMNINSAMWAFLSVYGLQGIIRILHSLYFSLQSTTESVTEQSIENINSDVLIIYIIYSVILAPITEEILFRGMILKNLSVVNKKFAIIFSSFLFGLFHENFPQMITATLIGILLAYVAVKSDSILIPIGLHIFNNVSNEIISYIPDSTVKTVVIAILFLGAGTFGLIMFIRSMKNSDTPEGIYNRIYEFDDLSNEKKASFRSVLASPAMVIYVIFFSLIIILNICGTLLL